MHESEKNESKVAQSCPTLSDPMDYSPPGSSIHGILQAGVLEWGAVAFSVVLLNVSLFVPFLHVGIVVSFHRSGVFYFNFYLAPQKT